MSKKIFTTLLQEFCTLVKIDKPDVVLREGNVMVGDVAFSLVHDEENAPALLSVYADFGKLPAKRELEVCMALMEANLFLFAGQGPIFGISPQTKQVTLAAHHPLDKLTPQDLHNILIDMASKATEWRQTSFLDLKPKPPGTNRGAFRALNINT